MTHQTAIGTTPAGLWAIEEEVANSLTHGMGLVLSIAGLIGLVAVAGWHGTVWHVVGCTVYGVSLVLLYTASTVYHMARRPGAKRVLRLADHVAIYLLIAGTYTPFTLISLRGPWGWTLLGVIWALATFGIALKLTFGHRHESASLGIYLAMGWICLLAAKPLVAAIPTGALWLLLGGGLAYTAGTLFYAQDKTKPYFHTVWHLFVLAGSALHYCAVYYYLLPTVA